MIDLHCHILPNVDDGASSLEESLEMARLYVRDGTTHVAATPHQYWMTHLLRADVLQHVERLNAQLIQAGIPLVVLPGSEVQVHDSAEYRHNCEAGRYCHLGDGSEFTLLEFGWRESQYPPDAAELIEWLRGRGMTPIVAHPERQRYLGSDPVRLRALVEAGAWLQITVDSLLGNHGSAPRSLGEELVRTYPDVVLATDAHNLERCSGLSPGYEWVREHLGAEREKDLRMRADRVSSSLRAAR